MCDMWYSKYSLECRHVTRPVLANELALAVRGEPRYEAVCCSSVLGWAGVERKYLICKYTAISGEAFKIHNSLMFSVSTLLRKIEQLFMGIMVLVLKLDASTLYLL